MKKKKKTNREKFEAKLKDINVDFVANTASNHTHYAWAYKTGSGPVLKIIISQIRTRQAYVLFCKNNSDELSSGYLTTILGAASAVQTFITMTCLLRATPQGESTP